MPILLDNLNARLLDAVQTEVPLAERPFEAIARKLEVDEAEVLSALTALKSPPRPVIRQIGAIFDSQSLGYRSTLVAAEVEPEQLETAVSVINRHPGVSHNYLRNHRYNLWYTLAVPPDSRLGLERTLDILHRQSGARVTRLMPTLRLFKIGVKLDLTGEANLMAASEAPAFTQEQREQSLRLPPVTEGDKRMIRVLQQDLPIESRPFDAWADQAGVTTKQLLEAAQAYREQKRMRRFSAVLRHREVGFSANAMGVWQVPAGQEEAFGKAVAVFAAVSHCYLRPTYPDWPYNLFTMVHAPTRHECETVLEAISAATGVTTYAALYSSKEFKKTRVKYFTGDTEAWESAEKN